MYVIEIEKIWCVVVDLSWFIKFGFMIVGNGIVVIDVCLIIVVRFFK